MFQQHSLAYKIQDYDLNEQFSINSLVELPLTGFKGATVQICAFTFDCISNNKGSFILINRSGFIK